MCYVRRNVHLSKDKQLCAHSKPICPSIKDRDRVNKGTNNTNREGGTVH